MAIDLILDEIDLLLEQCGLIEDYTDENDSEYSLLEEMGY